MGNPLLEKFVVELPLEQKLQLVNALKILGYKTQKEWLLHHIETDCKKAMEGETVAATIKEKEGN